MGLCEGVVHLYEIPKPSREFEHALGRFYDNVRHERIVDNLHDEKLQEFVNFLDEVRNSISLESSFGPLD